MRRVFVSHGLTQDPQAQQWLGGFLGALRRGGWQPFEYSRDIEAGSAWRDALWHALVDCDAGIVLRDARAGQRYWVRYEAAVLEARASDGSGFVVCEIPPEGDVERAAAEALHLLAPAPARPAAAPVAHGLDDAEVKARVDAFVLRAQVAQVLRAHLPRPDPGFGGSDAAPWLDLALQALPAGDAWAAAAQALLCRPEVALRSRHLPAEARRRILRLLQPFTVPARAAASVAAVFHRESAGRVLSLATDHVEIAEALLRRGWGIDRPMHLAPIVVLTTSVLIEYEHLVNCVKQEIARQNGLPPDCVDWLDRLLPGEDSADQNAGAVCVVLPLQIDADWFAALRAELPGCVWVVCGDAPGLLPLPLPAPVELERVRWTWKALAAAVDTPY